MDRPTCPAPSLYLRSDVDPYRYLWILTIKGMSADILPEINIPVVSVIWQYDGMPAKEMEPRIITNSERAMTTTVNDIEHIESQSMFGVGVIKVFFHPHANVAAAVA